MSRYVLAIDRWHPVLVNKLIKSHWRTAGRLKLVDKNIVGVYCQRNRIPLAQGPREVSLVVVFPSSRKGRLPDPDAYWKSLLDALVHARMLIDDSRAYVRTGSVEFERASERSTRIILEDL